MSNGVRKSYFWIFNFAWKECSLVLREADGSDLYNYFKKMRSPRKVRKQIMLSLTVFPKIVLVIARAWLNFDIATQKIRIKKGTLIPSYQFNIISVNKFAKTING